MKLDTNLLKATSEIVTITCLLYKKYVTLQTLLQLQTILTMNKNTTKIESAAEKKTTKKSPTRKLGTRKTTATKKKEEENANDTESKEETKTVTKATKTTKATRHTTRKKEAPKGHAGTEEAEQPAVIPAEDAVMPADTETKPAENTEEKPQVQGQRQGQAQAPVTIDAQPKEPKAKQELKIPALPQIEIKNIVELSQAPMRSIILTDQQIQSLTLEEIEQRHTFLRDTLANVLDYDVVISDTNIWLELLIGHTSSHSDPRINARLQFERQLEFISKYTKYRGGRFMMMSETYEEIDRFACMQDPTDHKEADFSDNIVCLNAAARLAKRLILSQQRENRLRIANIGAESHHAAFADPAIIRCVAEYFAAGKKVLLLTNDASVAIRSMGICDDLQRHNNISDEDWEEKYAPLRPMVFTFDDLRLLDFYTRQYHYIQMASGQPWMGNIGKSITRTEAAPLTLWQEAFKAGDKRKSDNLFTEQEQKQINQKQQQQKQARPQQQRQQKPQKQTKPTVSPVQEQANATIPEQKDIDVAVEKKQETPTDLPVKETEKKEVAQPKKKVVRRKPQNNRPVKKEEK